jgi:methionyl-tRNA formyltransferase
MQKNNAKVGVRIKWIFFGTTEFSVIVLEELKKQGYLPALVITVEDKPKGRKLVLTPSPVKLWAEKEKIPCLQPKTLRAPEIILKIEEYSPSGFDIFIIFSYGKIIPENILNMPRYGTLNLHPSLLPRLRGASPVKSAILTENKTGVTIIKLDKEMDHGPILMQEKINMPEWPPYESDLENKLAQEGGKMLAGLLPDFLDGKIVEKEQDHALATFCGKIEKTDGLLNMEDDPETNLRKIRAFHVWPGAYFFQNEKRIIVKRAHLENNKLILDRVLPEGKREMDYKDFIRTK